MDEVREEDSDDGLRGELEVLDQVAHELREAGGGDEARESVRRPGAEISSPTGQGRDEGEGERSGDLTGGTPGRGGGVIRALTESVSMAERLEALRAVQESAV